MHVYHWKTFPSTLVNVISSAKHHPVIPVESGPPLHRPRMWVHLLETVENEEFPCSGSGNAKPASWRESCWQHVLANKLTHTSFIFWKLGNFSSYTQLAFFLAKNSSFHFQALRQHSLLKPLEVKVRDNIRLLKRVLNAFMEQWGNRNRWHPSEQLLHELGTHCATPVWGLSARAKEEISVQPESTKPAPQPQFNLKPQPESSSLKPTAKSRLFK